MIELLHYDKVPDSWFPYPVATKYELKHCRDPRTKGFHSNLSE